MQVLNPVWTAGVGGWGVPLMATWGESRAGREQLNPVPAVSTGHSFVILYPAYNNVWSLQRGDRRYREGEGNWSFLPLSWPPLPSKPLPALSQLLSPSMNAPSGPMTSLAWNAWLPPEISSRAPRRHMLLMTSTQWATARFFSLWLWPASPLTLPPSASSSIPPSLSSSFPLCIGQSSVNSICSAHHITVVRKRRKRREPSSLWVLLLFLCI